MNEHPVNPSLSLKQTIIFTLQVFRRFIAKCIQMEGGSDSDSQFEIEIEVDDSPLGNLLASLLNGRNKLGPGRVAI